MTNFARRRCGRRRSRSSAGRAASSSLRTAGIGRPELKPDGGEVARAGGRPCAVGPPDIVTVPGASVADVLASRPTSPAPWIGFPNRHRKDALSRFGEPLPSAAHSASDVTPGRNIMSAGRDDRLGGRSDSQESGRTDTGPIKRFADDDRGENPAEHLPGADPEVARRLAGADTGSLRSQERDKTDRGAGQKPGQGGRGGDDGPPIYEGATSTSAVGGLDAG